MNAKEGEDTDQQAGHEYPNNVNRKVVVRVRRVVVRIKRGKRLGNILVAVTAGRHPIVRVYARRRVVFRKVLVGSVAVGACCTTGQAKVHGLAVETVPEGCQVFFMTAAAVLC